MVVPGKRADPFVMRLIKVSDYFLGLYVPKSGRPGVIRNKQVESVRVEFECCKVVAAIFGQFCDISGISTPKVDRIGQRNTDLVGAAPV